MKRCACGCGGEITQLGRPGWEPRYIKGHNGRGVPKTIETRPEHIFCECGCGTELRRAKYPSHQRSWVRGHQFIGIARSVTYDWSNLPADLDRYGSTAAVADAIGGVSQAEVHRHAAALGYSVTKFRSGSSRLGRLGEEIALSLLSGSEDMLHRGREPYDVLWQGQRINVKTATPSVWGWSFNTGRGSDECDAFFLVALNDREEFVAAWLVPVDAAAKGMRVGLGERTKYARYRYA